MAIPTPPYPMQLFWRDSDGAGWSEHYYLNVQHTFETGSILIAQLLSRRLAIATSECSVEHVRISHGITRAPLTFDTPTLSSTAGAFRPPTESTDVGLTLKLIGTGSHNNNIKLKGVPDNVIQLQTYVAQSAWESAFAAYQNFLTTNGQFVVRFRSNTDAQKLPVVQLSPAAGKGIYLNVPSTAVAISAGDVVEISGVMNPGYNGRKTVAVDNGTVGGSHQYVLTGGNPLAAPAAGVGKYVVVTYDSEAIAFVQLGRVTERKTGRPFGTQAGRRPTTFSQRP